MTNNHSNTIASFVFLLAFISMANVATASEVTGTLSSDGSTDTQQGVTLQETNAANNQATAQQNTGQIQGSVTGGREENAAAAFANPTTWDNTTWAITFAIAILGVFTYLFWSRRTI